jgi:ribosomal-protein-alanine N-acetyltransferase
MNKLFDDLSMLETDRLLLRRLTLEDVDDYYAFASDPLVTLHTIWMSHKSIEDSLIYLRAVIQKYEMRESFHWGIILKETNQVIGRSGLIHCDTPHQKAEIGFGLSSRYWGQGIITEANQAILQYAFEQLEINRIEGRCNRDNLASAKSMEKLGMAFEGMLRKQLKIQGQFIDQKMYGILASDYARQAEA